MKGLLARCTRRGYSNIKMKRIFIQADCCVWASTKLLHSFLLSRTSTGPPTRSSLEEQQQQQLMGVLQPHDQQSSQSADVCRTKPREGLCGMLHRISIGSPEADWVTEQCSGNITKTLLNFCHWPSLSLPRHPSIGISTGVPSVFLSLPAPPSMSQSQLGVLPKSNSCCGVR